MSITKKKSSGFLPQTLDVDDSIIDQNLKIVENKSLDDNITGLFPGLVNNANASTAKHYKNDRKLLPTEDYPTVQVTPTPGMCVKTKNVNNDKFFINLCKILEIPPAPPLSEEKLKEIIASEDYTADFRVPMSLGAPREEKDKSGGKCLASDVAINSIWYEETMVNSIAFTTFVINVAMEGLCEKYGDEANLDRQNWVILKNKKYLGTLQRHHIQQRGGMPGSKIEELSNQSRIKNPADSSNSTNRALISHEPDFTIFKNPIDSETPEYLETKIQLPGVSSKQEIMLDVGEDRLLCEATSASQKYILDIFLPFRLDQDNCKADFLREDHLLNIKLPILY